MNWWIGMCVKWFSRSFKHTSAEDRSDLKRYCPYNKSYRIVKMLCTHHMKSHIVALNQIVVWIISTAWLPQAAASSIQTTGHGVESTQLPLHGLLKEEKIDNSCDRVISEEKGEVILSSSCKTSPHSFWTRGRAADGTDVPWGPGLSSQLGVKHTLGSAWVDTHLPLLPALGRREAVGRSNHGGHSSP